MEIFLSVLKLMAGIGLFLFAMYLIEESLKNISGRNFKMFLQRLSKNTIGGATGGALVTAVLQSSSMVSMMVLAFVGAGVFAMKNAMAIILGANLGTTIDSWLVAGLGFKTNIEIVAYPVICLGGFLLILFRNRKVIKYSAYFLLGFGLLFIGLSFMKAAMENNVRAFNISKYTEMSLFVFLIIGFVLTTIVQSSSVTMALTLASLHAGVLNFPQACVIVLGSETGTTIKIFLSAIGSNAVKKRLALGNFIFNVIMTILAFIFLPQIIQLIKQAFNINDPLFGLVAFSSFINLLSIAIFLPFLQPFTDFLERFFKASDNSASAFINNANIREPETALDLFRKEAEYFIYNSMLFNLEQFEIDIQAFSNPVYKSINERKKYLTMPQEEKYIFLKQLQGELQTFYLELRSKLENDTTPQAAQLISSVRSAMHSVKSCKDIDSNINNLMRSSKNIKFDFFVHHKKETEQLYNKLYSMIKTGTKADMMDFKEVFEWIQNNFSSSLNSFYGQVEGSLIEDMDITTVINFNRELFTSNKAMLMAVKDLLLDEKQAQDFNEIPVYLT